MLRLDEYYVWDSWIADDGDLYHLYFLQAPRSLGDPAPRHVNATIGHATSKDLANWDYLGTSFAPSEIGRMAFDDMAVWTGSVINDGQQWWMFYTAISHAGHHLFDQRIGAAISTDLHNWQRISDEPAVLPDSRWYKTLAVKPSPTQGPDIERSSETWRDPLVFADPDGNGWHLLISARDVHAAVNDDGVIAHAPQQRSPALAGRTTAVPAGRRLRPARGLAEQDHRWSAGAGLHMPPPGDDGRAGRQIRRILHLVAALTGSHRTMGHQYGATLHRRAGPLRRASGSAEGRRLGDHRVPKYGAQRHRRVRDLGPHPGHLGRRGLSGRDLSKSDQDARPAERSGLAVSGGMVP